MPDVQLTDIAHAASRRRLRDLARVLNQRYGLDLAQILTAGPRQGLADETPYLYVARAHTAADVVIAVSTPLTHDPYVYVIEVYTVTAWFDLGDPFMVLRESWIAGAADLVTRYIPDIPTT